MRWLASIWQGFETLNGAMDYYTSYRGGYWSIWKINSYATRSLFGTGRNELISPRVSQNQTSLLTHLIKPPNKRPLCFTVKQNGKIHYLNMTLALTLAWRYGMICSSHKFFWDEVANRPYLRRSLVPRAINMDNHILRKMRYIVIPHLPPVTAWSTGRYS